MEKDKKEGSRSKGKGVKIERKVIEKNRRDQMRSLHSQLHSLLPPSHSSSKDTSSVLGQIDKVTDYIKELKEKIEKLKEKKTNLTKLTGNKRSFHSSSTCYPATSTATTSCYPSTSTSTSITTSTMRAPTLDIREIATGGGIEIALNSGLESQFLFYDIIRIVSEEGLEVINSNLTVSGNSVLHIVCAEVSEELATSGIGVAKAIERLEKLINGSTSDQPADSEELLLWNYDFDPISDQLQLEDPLLCNFNFNQMINWDLL